MLQRTGPELATTSAVRDREAECDVSGIAQRDDGSRTDVCSLARQTFPKCAPAWCHASCERAALAAVVPVAAGDEHRAAARVHGGPPGPQAPASRSRLI